MRPATCLRRMDLAFVSRPDPPSRRFIASAHPKRFQVFNIKQNTADQEIVVPSPPHFRAMDVGRAIR